MICKIIDGLFDDLYIHQIDLTVKNTPVRCNNIANRNTFPYGDQGSHRLFGKTFFSRQSLNRIDVLDENAQKFFDMFEMIENKLKTKFYLSEISLNIQHTNCDGTTHCDSYDKNDLTIMVMTNSKWSSDWGGQFQLTSENGEHIIEEHEYIPGRIILIPSTHPHRGLGPTKKYVYRSTVVFRVKPINVWNKNFID